MRLAAPVLSLQTDEEDRITQYVHRNTGIHICMDDSIAGAQDATLGRRDEQIGRCGCDSPDRTVCR